MTWQKGSSGSPRRSLRRGESWAEELRRCIRAVEQRKGKRLLVRAVEMAWSEPSLMAAILRKLVPDKTQIDLPVAEYLDAIQEVYQRRLEAEAEAKKMELKSRQVEIKVPQLTGKVKDGR